MQRRSVSCSLIFAARFHVGIDVHACSCRRRNGDDDPNEIFETIQELRHDRSILCDTALAGTRARRR